MTEQPLVSILILTWNRRDDCLKSIDSARAQTYPNTEIVLVDNDSPDGTAAAVRERYPGVRLIRSHKNLGCPSGRNLGFANCRGKYVYLLDDDGWLKEDAIEIVVRRAEQDEGLAAVMSRIHEVEGDRLVQTFPPGHDEPAQLHWFIGCCTLLRRSVLEEVGYFPDDFFRQGEESDLSLRILNAGYRIELEPGSIMYHAPSPVGRSLKAFRFYMNRNMIKTALRIWPFPEMLWRVWTCLMRSAKYSVVHRSPGFLLSLLGAFVKDVVTLPRARRPVSHKALETYRRLEKAYWKVVRSA